MKKYFIEAIIIILWLFNITCVPAYGEDKKVFVLVYHSFHEQNHYPTNVPMQELKHHMSFLQEKGFRFISFSDLLNGNINGNKNIMISIDDGNKSVYTAYQEVFKPLHIKPLLGIYPNIIGKKNYALSWNQLQELSKDGCDIAAHGYYHQLLNQKFYDESRDVFLKEIYGSKQILENRLNKKIIVFVYPDGIRSDIAKKTLKDAGYKYAFNILWGPVLCPPSLNKDPYELPRYMVCNNNWAMISNSIIKTP